MKDYRIDGNYTEDVEKILEQLGDILPHGSGIDYTWSIEQKKNGFIYASNTFHAMDEFGGYCHTYDFTAKYKYNGVDNFQECHFCNGKGIRYVKDMQQYHPDMSLYELLNFLKSTGLEIKGLDILDYYFECNGCYGQGKNKLHTYELINVNFHGQKENSCCGYGLKDYLYQVLYLD